MDGCDPDETDAEREPWYAARCIFCLEQPDQLTTYEERVILVRADSWEQAIRMAEEEAEEYVAMSEGWSYSGFLQIFHLFDRAIGHKSEVFSLMRTSELGLREYIDRFFDTGDEHLRPVDPD
ncbi:DUF4288 domain-containing protein [Tundrisphaera sp. TA3]|uniref:DUF4288 domain-containing protein n=1 Tax=Tundrisphaera sp. TA3 TaxID=3435775 RepID=UPI003EC07FC6